MPLKKSKTKAEKNFIEQNKVIQKVSRMNEKRFSKEFAYFDYFTSPSRFSNFEAALAAGEEDDQAY